MISIQSLFIAILLANFSLLVLAAGDCSHLKKLNYELHGTKTIYGDARKFLEHVNEDDLMKPFEDDSLEKEDHELRHEDHCTPMAFYFIGRHSARFPDGEDIEKYNNDLHELIEKLKEEGECNSRREKFINWHTKMEPKHDNLITGLGAREEKEIAARFKKIYPEFFNTKDADIEIGVTKKYRTAQTAAQFLSEVEGLHLDHCEHSSLPTDDIDESDYNLKKVLEAKCYKDLIEKHEKPFLEFHKECEEISGEKEHEDPLVERVKDPEIRKKIAYKVAKKLGLENHGSNPAISVKVLDSIYNMCKFENAIRDESIWCDLFEKKDIEALEYIEDVKSYIKDAYGPHANVKQSCPLVGDLVGAFHEALHLKENDKKKAYFYFSHAEPIKKVLAAFDMFRDDRSFSESKIKEFKEDLEVPKKRHWRSSIISPFSANVAFTMYRCEKPGKPAKHKIMATVTEQPVELGGCKDTDCNSEKFFSTYDSMQKKCDLHKICKH